MIHVKVTKPVYDKMRADLNRPHPFAYERVGFIFTRKDTTKDAITLLATEYLAVPDAQYIDDPDVGARINSDALRSVMERAYATKESILHVHLHDHVGPPKFSKVDLSGYSQMVTSFHNIGGGAIHGALVISLNNASGLVWTSKTSLPIPVNKLSIIGYPLVIHNHEQPIYMHDEKYDRQSFLGADSQIKIESCTVGIIGLGGGGSHIAQQLAHIGFQNYVLYDPDIPEESNLNRLVGAKVLDVKKKTPKIQIARRGILGLQPEANVLVIHKHWQEGAGPLKTCDIIFGCIDGYKGRQELEAFSRRHLIPYIDIGIDIHDVEPEPPRLSGQIIVSIPGGPCMQCLSYLTEKKLSIEAAKYGAAGKNPQVIWANGIVASAAVGIAVDIVTGWTRSNADVIYLSYEGNLGQLTPHALLKFATRPCPHFPADSVGEPAFTLL